MSGSQTYERLIRYLKGLLSNRERHELEKDIMKDPFDEEAFEGISQMQGDDLENDLSALYSKLDARVDGEKHRSRNLRILFRIAASIVLLFGLGAAFYMVFHKPDDTGPLSQEIRTKETSAYPETIEPEAPAMAELPESVSGDKNLPAKSPVSKKVEIQDNREELVMTDSLFLGNKTVRAEKSTETPAAVADEVAEEIRKDTIEEAGYSQDYITGRVLGINRQALAGVTVMEEGTATMTITDRNGNFRLPVTNTASKIALKYNGYKPMEVPSREIAGKEVSMNEDMAPLSEVMVTGYGQKKAANQVSAASESKARAAQTAYKYYKPVPHGGSLKAFQAWVEENIDVEKFMDLLPGNYKVIINLTVGTDGSLNQIRTNQGIPGEVSEEYKRVVALSPLWQPARANESPVEAEVQLIFYLILQ